MGGVKFDTRHVGVERRRRDGESVWYIVLKCCLMQIRDIYIVIDILPFYIETVQICIIPTYAYAVVVASIVRVMALVSSLSDNSLRQIVF